MNRALTTIAVSALGCLLLESAGLGADDSEVRGALEPWIERYGIDRPWDPLTDMPAGERRHRGALAHVSGRLRSGGVPKEAEANLYRDLGRLLDLDEAGKIAESKPAFSDYREFFEIDVFGLWKQILTGTRDPVRWKASLREFYYSRADGAGVSFEVRLPPEPAPGKPATFPLLVVLKGGPSVSPSAEFPFIQVKPSRGRIWGYRAISGYDAMEVIAFMKRHYPVDPDRVYLTGFSAGASAAMHLASCHADEFAAVLPLVAVGTGFPVPNFKNLPVAIHHGTDDWTSSICNARVQFQKMKNLGCPVIHQEYPGVGHSVPKPHDPLIGWLFGHTRDRVPAALTHECEAPALGRAFWIRLREFQDPHRRAHVAASVSFSTGGDRGTVKVHPRNVAALSLDLGRLSGEGRRVDAVEIDGQRLKIEGDAARLDCRVAGGRWGIVTPGEDSGDGTMRPYQAGAAANLYQGEPLLIVHGTGLAGRAGQLRSAARRLAACGGPVHAQMRGRFPAVADTALSAEQEANCNLILIGTPAENRVTAKILPRLPIAIRKDTLTTPGRPDLPLQGQVLSLLVPHPDHPGRLVYLLAPFTDDDGLARFSAAPEQFLAGSDGFDRVSQADLLVQNLDRQIGRRMQFGKTWDWIDLPGSEKNLPARFGERASLAATHLEIMRRKSGADFALWWGPADRGMWGYDFNFLKRYNPAFFTEADFNTRQLDVETMTGGVSGVELKEIWNRWGPNRELLSVPEIRIDALEDDKSYRVHIPMDLYIKLGQRKKALADPRPGPVVTSREVGAEIFP